MSWRGCALRGRMTDVLQHQFGRRTDVDLAGRDAERPHQRVCILERLAAGAEARQRVAEDVGARQAEPIERTHGDQRGLRRIESARDADDDALQSRGREPFAQRLDLDVVDLGAALVAARRVGRHVRKPLDAAIEPHVVRRHVEFDLDASIALELPAVRLHAVAKGRPPHALLAQVVQIEVRRDEAALQRKAHRLGQPCAVLVDEGVAVPGQVGRRFAGTGRRVEIARDALRRLRSAEQPAVIGLADRDVARRQVRDHRGSRQRGIGARRQRRPDVLADFEAQHEAGYVLRLEQEAGTEGHRLPEQPDRRGKGLCRRCELPLLVKLAVIGQVALGHCTQQFPAAQEHGAVEQPVVHPQRHAHREGDGDLLAGLEQRSQGLHRAVEQGILLEQVLVRVRGRYPVREIPPGPPDLTAASRAIRTISTTFAAGEATSTHGVATATRTKP